MAVNHLLTMTLLWIGLLSLIVAMYLMIGMIFLNTQKDISTEIDALALRQIMLRQGPLNADGGDDMVMTIWCPECNGFGFTIESAHHQMCDCSCSMCPVPVQVPCQCCGGIGEIEIEEQEY